MHIVYDYIIIGAGPAGCFCAIELKKKGFNCIVLEKHKENHGKVCGGGISLYCTKILHNIGFPLHRFEEEGAVKIKQYRFYYNNELYINYFKDDDFPDFAYGIERSKIDSIFRQYTQEHGVDIIFGFNVKKFRKEEGLYNINGYFGRSLILACGALRTLKRFSISSEVNKLPVGVSAIIRTHRYRGDNFFLFDYENYFDGQYGWIFSIGEQMWNIGVWTKNNRKNIKKLFTQFTNTRVKEYFNDNYEFMTELKGAAMGISNNMFDLKDNSIFLIGDTSYTSNNFTGEGIPQAILSGIELVDNISTLNS